MKAQHSECVGCPTALRSVEREIYKFKPILEKNKDQYSKLLLQEIRRIEQANIKVKRKQIIMRVEINNELN